MKTILKNIGWGLLIGGLLLIVCAGIASGLLGELLESVAIRE